MYFACDGTPSASDTSPLTWSSPSLDFDQGRPHHHFQALMLLIVPYAIHPWSDLLPLGPSVQASVFGHWPSSINLNPLLDLLIYRRPF